MNSALWFILGLFVGSLISFVVLIFAIGAHSDETDYSDFDETK